MRLLTERIELASRLLRKTWVLGVEHSSFEILNQILDMRLVHRLSLALAQGARLA